MIRNELLTTGVYLSTRGSDRYIVRLEGSIPTLRVTRVIDISLLADENKVTSQQDSVRIAKEIEANFDAYTFSPYVQTPNPTSAHINKDIDWTEAEMIRWIDMAKSLSYGETLVKLSMEEGRTWNIFNAKEVYEEIQKEAAKRGITIS